MCFSHNSFKLSDLHFTRFAVYGKSSGSNRTMIIHDSLSHYGRLNLTELVFLFVLIHCSLRTGLCPVPHCLGLEANENLLAQCAGAQQDLKRKQRSGEDGTLAQLETGSICTCT